MKTPLTLQQFPVTTLHKVYDKFLNFLQCVISSHCIYTLLKFSSKSISRSISSSISLCAVSLKSYYVLPQISIRSGLLCHLVPSMCLPGSYNKHTGISVIIKGSYNLFSWHVSPSLALVSSKTFILYLLSVQFLHNIQKYHIILRQHIICPSPTPIYYF